MKLDPSRGSAVISDAFNDGDEEIEKAKVDVLGSRALLYVWDPMSQGYEEHDKISDAKMTATRDGVITYTGVSENLRREIGAPAEDCMVSWIITPKGCQNCG